MNDSLDLFHPGELSSADLKACISLIQEGGAVNVRSATDTLPLSIVVLKRVNDEIVGVGAIKPPRPDYAADKAQQSCHAFDSQMRELGYVAVRTAYRGQGISKEITAALLSSCQGQSLFATTSNEGMMKTLGNAGFVRRGEDWKGNSGGTLQLWIKE